jgi:hypothetical protein
VKPVNKTIPDIVADIKYRHWDFFADPIETKRAEGTQTNFYEVTVSCETIDVSNEGNSVYLKGTTPLLPENADEPTVIEAIFALISRLEEHERKEFFYYQGKRVFNPHRMPK